MRHDKQFRMGPRGMRGGGGPRSGRREEAEVPSAEGIEGWFAGRLPDGWFEGPPEVTVDRDEVLVVGRVPAPESEGTDAEAGRVARFRESTRDERIAIAQEAEQRYGRHVAWGARAGATVQVFTTVSVPVMTRLRQPERQVLDTLVAAGVARSRSDALAWSVRLVGEHAQEWLGSLREAMKAVDEVRTQPPVG